MTQKLNSPGDMAMLLADLPGPDEAARQKATARQAVLTKPPGSLGRLEALAIWFAGWRGMERPAVTKAAALVFAGNHGVTERGVSPYPREVTAQMVANFQAGGAAINQLCKASGAELTVTALDLDWPTGDITAGPAMSDEECLGAINAGMAAVPADADVILLGEMGIGNTTIAAALAMACFGGTGADWAGPGTGLDADGVSLKAGVVDEAVTLHREHAVGAFEMLARLGGREQAALAGAALAARLNKVPVILDGFISSAAVGVLEWAKAGALDHCIAGHRSREPGHARLLEALKLEPVVDLEMRLGEGSGAAVALGVLRAGLAAHNGMATFAEAGVTDRD
jgi:nicotinate-nucleotide--dimethylbenzimidazole phosphoribosyltransferase